MDGLLDSRQITLSFCSSRCVYFVNSRRRTRGLWVLVTRRRFTSPHSPDVRHMMNRRIQYLIAVIAVLSASAIASDINTNLLETLRPHFPKDQSTNRVLTITVLGTNEYKVTFAPLRLLNDPGGPTCYSFVVPSPLHIWKTNDEWRTDSDLSLIHI